MKKTQVYSVFVLLLDVEENNMRESESPKKFEPDHELIQERVKVFSAQNSRKKNLMDLKVCSDYGCQI